MANLRYEDTRYTLIFVKRNNSSLPGAGAGFYDLFPLCLMRFNVDSNPDGVQYLEAFGSNDYGLTSPMDGKNSKRYTEPLFLDEAPYAGWIGTSGPGLL
jgi:hypothetical protein